MPAGAGFGSAEDALAAGSGPADLAVGSPGSTPVVAGADGGQTIGGRASAWFATSCVCLGCSMTTGCGWMTFVGAGAAAGSAGGVGGTSGCVATVWTEGAAPRSGCACMGFDTTFRDG